MEISGLKDIARLYQGVLFSVATLRLGTGGPCSAGAIRCAQELGKRQKLAAAVSGSAVRAKTHVASLANAGMKDLAAWSSGEFICRSLAKNDLFGLPPQPRVFELGNFVKPQRWTELVHRSPPLEGLVRAGHIRRTESVEHADVCYWDAQEGDHLDHWLEAAVELCVDLEVPLLQPKWSASALETIAPLMDASGTLESTALKVKRLGGRVLSVGKLEGAAEALNLAPRDALLVTLDLGDLVEASTYGMDTLLIFGAQARQQLRVWAEMEAQQERQRRKSLSVSERVAEDSPRMMAAANNPFFAVFQLPSLLAEATAKNKKQREAKRELPQASAELAPEQHQAIEVDTELLLRWCRAVQVEPPRALMSTLSWSSADESEKTSPVKEAVKQPAPEACAHEEPEPEPKGESLETLLAQIEGKIMANACKCTQTRA